MSFTQVQSKTSVSLSGASFNLTLDNTPTEGNMLIYIGGGGNNGNRTVSGVSQTGVTWAQANLNLWYGIVGAGASATMTITITGSAPFCNIGLEYASSISGTWHLDVVSITGGSSSNPHISSVNNLGRPGTSLEIGAAIIFADPRTIISGPGGNWFSAADSENSGDDHLWAWYDPVGQSTTAFSITLNTSSGWGVAVATFYIIQPPPNPAFDPSPEDGQINIHPFRPAEEVLSWSIDETVLYQTLGFSTDPNSIPNVASLYLLETEYDLSQNDPINGSLAPSTTYYWRIITQNNDGSTIGPTWSFTTQALVRPKYNVYYALSPDGPWTKANDQLISDIRDGNSFTITGLTPGSTYFIMVVGGYVDPDTGVWTPSAGQPIGPGAEGASGTSNPNMISAKPLGDT